MQGRDSDSTTQNPCTERPLACPPQGLSSWNAPQDTPTLQPLWCQPYGRPPVCGSGTCSKQPASVSGLGSSLCMCASSSMSIVWYLRKTAWPSRASCRTAPHPCSASGFVAAPCQNTCIQVDQRMDQEMREGSFRICKSMRSSIRSGLEGQNGVMKYYLAMSKKHASRLAPDPEPRKGS